MLNLNHLSFTYKKGPEALADVTGTLKPGIHLLLGENGAGKTTLLKVMAGLLRPAKGEVLLDGLSVGLRSPQVMRSLFFLPETMEVPFATFGELARYHAPMYPAFSAADFSENLAAFGLDGSERIADCSLGTRRKGLAAYALALHTPLLMMDEPANGLDINSRKALRAIMARCVAPEQTVIVSTHNIADLRDLYDGLMMLHRGRLEICRPTDALACSLESVAGALDYALLYSALMSTAAPQVLAAANR